jgi:hypothetical protein
MMAHTRLWSLLLVGAVSAAAGCSDEAGPTEIEREATSFMADDAVLTTASLASLVTRTIDGSDLTFWPYTGRTPTLGDAADPINLVLVGDADPRAVRARLLGLSGDRSAFGLPPVAPFDCTWSDAIGGTQAVYSEPSGWSGSVVQLQCGNYEDLRIHVRLFRVDGVTMANAHLDVRIPGTTDHEVVSWQLPRALTALDLQHRLGASPVGLLTDLTDHPTYRSILGPVFSGLPAGFIALLTNPAALGLPAAWASATVTGDLLNDGTAPVFSMPAVGSDPDGAVISRQTVEIAFDQVIPRPFCSDDGQELLQVQGPVTLTQQVVATPSGAYSVRYHATGRLDLQQVVPTGPGTFAPTSEPYRALVNQHGRGVMTDQTNMINDIQLRMEIRGKGLERGQLMLNVRMGPDGAGAVRGSASCSG